MASSSREPDDLRAIKGVGPKLEGLLHREGVNTYAQIARWNAEDISAMDDKLQFHGRIERDEWVAQATQFHIEKYGTQP